MTKKPLPERRHTEQNTYGSDRNVGRFWRPFGFMSPFLAALVEQKPDHYKNDDGAEASPT
jgi:hypothetical protein